MTQVDAKQHIAPGTGLHVGLASLAAIVIIGITVLVTWGLAIFGWLIAALFYSYRAKKANAALRGSAVEVTAEQFPEIYGLCRDLSARLGLSEPPQVYIAEASEQNAFALKYGKKRSVVLIDDIVYGALSTGNEKVLAFILGHELAHHALGHTHFIRSVLVSSFRALSRLDEFSCDSVANALVADTESARDALTLLLVGPHLYKAVNRAALDWQAGAVAADSYSRKAERALTHPLLLRRYARLLTPQVT